VDGKKMRLEGVEMVNATNGQGQFLGGKITAQKSNEIANGAGGTSTVGFKREDRAGRRHAHAGGNGSTDPL